MSPRPESIGDERAADEKALRELASEREREVARGAVLDADRDRGKAVVARELDQRAQIRESAGIVHRSAHQRARDLELVKERGEGPSRCVRNTRAVESNARAGRGQAQRRRTCDGVRKRSRAHLEGDGAGPERSERFEQRIDAGELGRGDVDADAKARADAAPLGPLGGCCAYDPHADLLDERGGGR